MSLISDVFISVIYIGYMRHLGPMTSV